MADSVNGVKVTKKQFMDAAGIAPAIQRRLRELEAKAANEMQRRIRAEQECAGYKSAVKRLQAMVLDHKAREAKQAARVFDAEVAAE